MMKIRRWLVRRLRWTHTEPIDTQRARDRLAEVTRDDGRVDELSREVQRVRRQNNLGPQISRALRARRP